MCLRLPGAGSMGLHVTGTAGLAASEICWHRHIDQPWLVKSQILHPVDEFRFSDRAAKPGVEAALLEDSGYRQPVMDQ